MPSDHPIVTGLRAGEAGVEVAAAADHRTELLGSYRGPGKAMERSVGDAKTA